MWTKKYEIDLVLQVEGQKYSEMKKSPTLPSEECRRILANYMVSEILRRHDTCCFGARLRVPVYLKRTHAVWLRRSRILRWKICGRHNHRRTFRPLWTCTLLEELSLTHLFSTPVSYKFPNETDNLCRCLYEFACLQGQKLTTLFEEWEVALKLKPNLSTAYLNICSIVWQGFLDHRTEEIARK